MNCPRCPGIVLEERQRDGMTIDVCPGCRGLWLDRGELEKLIARATTEFDELASRHGDTSSRRHRHRGDDDDYYYRGRKKRRWFESLGEIFD
jgi:Zn-finger nucleic acid-binding protein